MNKIDNKHFKMGLALVGISVSIPTADLIEKTYIKVLELGGEFSINDASDLQFHNKEEFFKCRTCGVKLSDDNIYGICPKCWFKENPGK